MPIVETERYNYHLPEWQSKDHTVLINQPLPKGIVMSTNLNGKVAFINGGSRGIGAATARRLASEGAKVAIGYAASAIAAEALVEEIKAAGGEAIAIKADATDVAALTKAIDSVADR